MMTLDGRDGLTSSMDIVSSSSASQSETTIDERGEVSGGGVERYDDCEVSGFRRIMARFQSRILDPVLSIGDPFLFCERLRPGLYDMKMSGRATLTEGLDVFEVVV